MIDREKEQLDLEKKLSECIIYQTVEVPGIGTLTGDWDFRQTAAEYLGYLEFKGKSVLEIGPANGFFTQYMEERGADVTGYDLPDTTTPDFIPYAGEDMSGEIAQLKTLLRKLNNAWWLLHDAANLKARLITGTVYDLEPSFGKFDIGLVGAVLLHLRDPFLALKRVADLTLETMVVVELVPFRDLPGWTGTETEIPAEVLADKSNPELIFRPRDRKKDAVSTWWHITPACVRQMLFVLGFEDCTTNFHIQRQHNYTHVMHTTVAHRTRKP